MARGNSVRKRVHHVENDGVRVYPKLPAALLKLHAKMRFLVIEHVALRGPADITISFRARKERAARDVRPARQLTSLLPGSHGRQARPRRYHAARAPDLLG